MTELHPKAKELLRLAKSSQTGGAQGAFGQEPTDAELRAVMDGFQRRAGERSGASVSRLHSKRRKTHGEPVVSKELLHRATANSWLDDFAHHYRRGLLKWSLLTAIMTGSLGAFANWGPREWREDLGHLADRVTESLGELVVSVTGGGPSQSAARRTSAELDAAQAAGQSTVTALPAPTVALLNAGPATAGVEAAPEAVAALEHRLAAPRPRLSGSEFERALLKSNTAGLNQAPSAPHSTGSTTARGPSAFSEVEVNLISAARSALASGNYAQTRRLLDEHRSTFPRGALSEERETLRALVACRESGNTDLAQRYVTRRPQSLFAPRLIRECGLSTTPPSTPSEPANNIP